MAEVRRRAKCAQCGGTEIEAVTIDHPYDESGLPGVTLHGISADRCLACGSTRVRIPNIEGLHRALALFLLRKTWRLSGPEVRFLRKYIGLSGADFAKRIGAEPETVSRWENGKQPIGAQAERLLRLLVVTMGQIQEYPVEDLDNLDSEVSDPPSATIRLERKHNDWAPSAA